jgi:hypothetical protein
MNAATRIGTGTDPTERKNKPRKHASSATKRVAKRTAGNENLRNLPKIIRGILPATSLALAFFFLSSLDIAQAADRGRALFDEGRLAFERKDYARALANYEAAKAAGLESSAVAFNIGVAAYRTQQFARARQAFEEAARDPAMAALAHYNLGLVAKAEHDEAAAAKWFRRVEQEATDERLRALATRQLGEPEPSTGPSWDVYLSAALGYDDNVTLVSDSSVLNVSGESDFFTEAQAGLSVVLDSPWQFDAGFSHLDYFDQDEYDLVSLFGAARYIFDTENWTHEGRFQQSYSRLDNSSFEMRRSLSFQSTRDLDKHWRFRARYRLSFLDGIGARYSGLDGTRHEALARIAYRGAGTRYSASYEYEINDQQEESLPTRRHQLRLRGAMDVNALWSVELEAGIERQGGRDDFADETLTEIALSLQRVLTDRWRLLCRSSYGDNNSDTAALNYTARQISIGIESSF